MENISKEDVIEVISNINDPTVLAYLYYFAIDVNQKFGQTEHKSEADPEQSAYVLG